MKAKRFRCSFDASLKLAGMENEFERYESNQLITYRLCSGISTLCAGFALAIGHMIAYGTDLITGLIQIIIISSLHEVYAANPKKDTGSKISRRLIACIKESISFLKEVRQVMVLMLCNSFVGAVDILLLFFLQAKLPEKEIPKWSLGLALLFMEMGGIVGSKLILKLPKLSYKWIFAMTSAFVLTGFLAEHSTFYFVMTLGGFIAAAGDDALQVRTNAIIQSMFPSEQRATLTSVESFSFSVIMIVLSPLAGVVFTHW